ncbi:MAG: NAD(P)H-hydrate dehydratase [Sphingorhabdus sp.]
MTFILQLAVDGTIEKPVLNIPPVDTHKYRRGHAVVFSGPQMRTGASRLAAQAALHVGAGVVTLVGDENSLREHASHVTAIMLRELDVELSCLDDRVMAVAIGPGAGDGEELRERIIAVLDFSIPVVLDADALTCFEGSPARLFSHLHAKCILTPHMGEFARVFQGIDLEDKGTAALEAARRSGAVVLLKGPETCVATPSGQLAVNRHSAAWLATAGSGDVLTGLICGLMAQGHGAYEAACMASWLHGDIGVTGGPGLTADTMIGQIPLVLRNCLVED